MAEMKNDKVKDQPQPNTLEGKVKAFIDDLPNALENEAKTFVKDLRQMAKDIEESLKDF